MSIQLLFQGLKNVIKPQPQNTWELLLFPKEMKDRELLRRAPQAKFFLEISAKIAGKSKHEIHSYFDQYTTQIDLQFANWIEAWGKARLVDGKPNSKVKEILNAFCAIWDFPRGNRANNLEIFLVVNQVQMLFVDREECARSWANIQNNLAAGYATRKKGDRAENLEQSIDFSKKALEIYTKNYLPIDWAMTQNNLAVAYLYRIRGNRAESLEKSINFSENALEVYTKNDVPIDWATTQNNLANAYFDRIRGDRSENLEKSIYHYQKALEAITKKDFPIDWAMIQNNLAMAYSERIRGDRSENLEKSIYYYQKALEIRTKKDFPIDWAMTKSNLASTCLYRIRGDLASNLEKSIYYYQKALEIRTKKDFPIDWAMIQNNLGTAYLRFGNLQKSIYYYHNALEIRTKRDFPIDWAITQNNLAIAYKNRIRGDQSENLEKSIEYYENALPIIASSGFLQQLENLKDDLADAYLQRVNIDTKDISELDNDRNNQTNKTLQQLTQNCLEQADWYKATLSLSLCSKALISQKAFAQAAQPLLKAISLDIQHNPQLIDTDLQEFASLMTQIDWQPDILSSQWQVANSTLPEPISPLTPELQAQICLTIGIISIQEKYWYKGLDWLKACWEIHQQLDDLPGLAEVSYQLAIGHHIASNLSLAGIYYRDAQRIFQHLNDPRKVAFCHHGLGRLLLQLGKTELAIREFDQALAIYQTIPDRPQVASRIGDIHYYQRVITKMQDPTLTHQSL